MELFTVIEDSNVILHSKGVYKQTKAYQRGERIYAAHAGGFIRLGAAGMTSTPNVRYDLLDVPFEPLKGKTGEPLVPPATVTQIRAVAA